MTDKPRFQFLVDGHWLEPVSGPPIFASAFLEANAEMTMATLIHCAWLTFDHPAHGTVCASPRSVLGRIR